MSVKPEYIPGPNRYVESEAEFVRRMQRMLESVDWEGDSGPNNDDLNRMQRLAEALELGAKG